MTRYERACETEVTGSGRIVVVMGVEDVGKGPREVPRRWYFSAVEANETLHPGEWIRGIGHGA